MSPNVALLAFYIFRPLWSRLQPEKQDLKIEEPAKSLSATQ